jgi:uncharacterized membrane protein YgcG
MFRFLNENNCRNIWWIQKIVVPLHQRCKTRTRKRFKEKEKTQPLKARTGGSGNTGGGSNSGGGGSEEEGGM